MPKDVTRFFPWTLQTSINDDRSPLLTPTLWVDTWNTVIICSSIESIASGQLTHLEHVLVLSLEDTSWQMIAFRDVQMQHLAATQSPRCRNTPLMMATWLHGKLMKPRTILTYFVPFWQLSGFFCVWQVDCGIHSTRWSFFSKPSDLSWKSYCFMIVFFSKGS